MGATKHEVYKPYKLVFAGLGDDIKAFTAPSRKAFDRFLVAVRDSLLPTGQPLTLNEMNDILSDFDVASLKLNRHFRAKGFHSLKDLTDHGLTLGHPDASDLHWKLSDGKLVPLSSHPKGKSPESVEQLNI